MPNGKSGLGLFHSAMKPARARLNVLLARDARLGLVIRHGPAKPVCTLLWNRKKDEFTPGQ